MSAERLASYSGGKGGLAVEVTPDCNRRCAYCYNGWERDGESIRAPLPASELVEIVERTLRDSGRNGLQFSGGEPLLRTDFFDIVDGLRKPGRPLSLVTDGGCIDEALADRIKLAGLAPVQPTLLSADRALHDRIKGVPGAFDATVRAIGLLLSRHVPVTVTFVCTRENADDFGQVIELCFALGVRTLAFNRFCTAGTGAANQSRLAPSPEQLRRCLDVAAEGMRVFGMKIPKAISLPLCLPTAEQMRNVRLGRCALGTEMPGFTIDPWGRLRACSVSDVILGDLSTESWDAVMRRSRTGYFAQMLRLPDACRECSLATQCGGGCRESARCSPSGLSGPDPLALD